VGSLSSYKVKVGKLEMINFQSFETFKSVNSMKIENYLYIFMGFMNFFI